MSRSKWFCLDCKVDTGKIGEYYFLDTDLWISIVGSKKGMMCIGCFEKRLGRKLVKSDFTDCHINNPKIYNMSMRLLSRLK